MKKMLCLVLVMLLCSAGAVAQEYVSVAELYDQAQAMGGWWKETFDTPNGEVTVDAPIIVPDVETMPVPTLQKAKISEEWYEKILQGKKIGRTETINYEIEVEGETIDVYLGEEHPWFYGTQSDVTGYDAVSVLYVQRGAYRPSLGIGMGTAEKQAQPTTYHYPWKLDPSQQCLRNVELTLNDAMDIVYRDLALFYPDENFEIQPTLIKLRGSTLSNEVGTGAKYKRDGYMVIESAEQLINGVPIMGTITSRTITFDSGDEEGFGKAHERLIEYARGNDAVIDGSPFYGNFTDASNYRMRIDLAKIRTVEYEDIPLASLETVLAALRKEIEAGNLREVNSVRLGYILYSNPEMKDYAWAIPRWVVDAVYVAPEDHKRYKEDMKEFYCHNVPIDAQSGEMIVWTLPTKEVYEVPEIATWENVR